MAQESLRWYALDINPEPWDLGRVSVGRFKGKYTGTISPNKQLQAYQNAVREEIGPLEGLITHNIELVFFFWRNRAEYTTQNQRQHRKHEADVTNLQKGLEDALQSILYVNDRDVVHTDSWLVEQGPDVRGRILIGIRELENRSPMWMMPLDALAALRKLDDDKPGPSENTYDKNVKDVF